MTTYSQIKTDVQTIIIDAPTRIVTAIPLLVNKALREIQRRHNYKVMEALAGPLSTTEGARTLTAQTDFKELRDRPYMLFDDGFHRELVASPSRAAVIRNWEADDEGEPRALLQAEQADTGAVVWEVWPLPDGNSDYDDGEYRIYIPYWRFLPALSADADTNWFTVNAQYAITYLAAAEGFFWDWDEERGTVWAQKAQNELAPVILADKNRALMDVDTLVPYQGVFEAQLQG